MSHGGRRAGAGRPPVDRPRVQLAIRCESEEQRATWQRAAEVAGRDLSEVTRDLLTRWARRTLAKAGA